MSIIEGNKPNKITKNKNAYELSKVKLFLEVIKLKKKNNIKNNKKTTPLFIKKGTIVTSAVNC